MNHDPFRNPWIDPPDPPEHDRLMLRAFIVMYLAGAIMLVARAVWYWHTH